jgi:hypothetical protein
LSIILIFYQFLWVQYHHNLVVAKYYTDIYFNLNPAASGKKPMQKERNDIQLLMSLGLNELEAEVYVLLLTQPSLTVTRLPKC